jgi:hypothetical protein
MIYAIPLRFDFTNFGIYLPSIQNEDLSYFNNIFHHPIKASLGIYPLHFECGGV